MANCVKCLISDAVPGIILGKNGICHLCENYKPEDSQILDRQRAEREADLEKALRECKNQAEYDCLVPLSGGKDSIYLLYKLKVEYGLKVLAFTTDINIPPLAWDNIRRTLNKLDIDHVVYRPSEQFYQKLFRHLLKNQEPRGAVYTVSYVYAPLFEGDAIKLALEKNIPLILAGYSPGQPEPERMLYEFSRDLIAKVDWTPPALKTSTEFDELELSRFFNPQNYPSGTVFPRYLAPYHAWPYNQEQIMQKVVQLGLVKSGKHASPIFSNYPINWLLMYSDLKHFGYNPYLPEFSALIREGKANVNQWRILVPIIDFMLKKKVFLGREVTRSLKWLDLSEKELTVNHPLGAYDPPMIATRRLQNAKSDAP
ncbi:hypothetical protein [Methylomonas sp. 2B]|uniref:hypothetical protein n=1 Tax=Methylomonas sp. 2B TaxID=3367743 RepID=UPI0037CC65C2